MYCIINGHSSSGVRGLQILSVPPVKVPPIRTMIDTIDGRPGDIVTRLGYEAYDKTMQIGLVNDYDEDEIISFFAQSGIITFSNEPDKYYKFEMINEIEFERFLKYRQATVTFHVQPYKYSYADKERSFIVNMCRVTNRGNADSAPTYTLEGTGKCALQVDGITKLIIEMPETPITIDTDKMDAYYEGTLLNRNVTGDYEDLHLSPGPHEITWLNQVLGESITKLTISNYSRWR